tara:strand:+ start:156 stop:560 length:405 start_codon:yes stop_codon:yes gene_type:complete
MILEYWVIVGSIVLVGGLLIFLSIKLADYYENLAAGIFVVGIMMVLLATFSGLLAGIDGRVISERFEKYEGMIIDKGSYLILDSYEQPGTLIIKDIERFKNQDNLCWKIEDKLNMYNSEDITYSIVVCENDKGN